MSPLEGIRVLDFSRVLAGPFCSMILGDMGAQVIKVEEPGKGDDTRSYGPPFVNGESAYFLSVNRNKLSLTLNLKHPESLKIARELARISDVVLENFRPGQAEKLGIDYEALRQINPRLIYASISGFGHTGPAMYRPGYDLVVQGMSGIMDLTGDPSGPPLKVGTSMADLVAGMYCCQGILLALIARERTGTGQKLEVSLLESYISMLTFQGEAYLGAGIVPHRMGNQHPTICPYETFRASDGYFNLAVGNDRIWTTFCKLLKMEGLLADERFATNPQRVKHRTELCSMLEPIFSEKSVAEWIETFDRAGIPSGPILSVPEALEHPQIQTRNMVAQVCHPRIGNLKLFGIPTRLSVTPGEIRLPPPLLGEHTESILDDLLGFTREEICRLRDTGAI